MQCESTTVALRERKFVRHEAIMKSLSDLFSAGAGKFIQRLVARQITLYKSTSASQRALVTTARAPLECYRTLPRSAGFILREGEGGEKNISGSNTLED